MHRTRFEALWTLLLEDLQVDLLNLAAVIFNIEEIILQILVYVLAAFVCARSRNHVCISQFQLCALLDPSAPFLLEHRAFLNGLPNVLAQIFVQAHTLVEIKLFLAVLILVLSVFAV